MRNFLCRHSYFHLIIGKFLETRYACVRRKTAVSLYKFTLSDARTTFKRVNVLGKAHVQKSFILQKSNETMRDGRPELARL